MRPEIVGIPYGIIAEKDKKYISYNPKGKQASDKDPSKLFAQIKKFISALYEWYKCSYITI